MVLYHIYPANVLSGGLYTYDLRIRYQDPPSNSFFFHFQKLKIRKIKKQNSTVNQNLVKLSLDYFMEIYFHMRTLFPS